MHDFVMRLFVSYSRSDAQFVGRLTDALEAEGHDVWVDTDDIVGSEQWRASIVAGVQRADAVLLIVSPRSMASPNVEREITVAAEEARRIIPLVLESAEMTGSILFVLAGAQQISFAGRPFDIAMEDLRGELRKLPPDPVGGGPLPSPAVAATAPRNNRRRAALAVVILGLVAGVVYSVTRGGDNSPAEGGSPSASATATVGVLPSGSATATEPVRFSDVPLDATVWFSGFEIAATSVTFNPAAGVVEMPVTFTNDTLGAADPLGMLQAGAAAIEWPGGRLDASCVCSTQLPPGNVLPTTVEIDVPADFDLQGAVFVLGGAKQHQAKIPLDGTAATSDLPVPYEIQGQIDDGAGTTFTIEKVRVVSADCWGLADDLTYVPGSVDRVSVEVVGSAVYTGDGNVNFGDAALIVPNGSTIGSESLTSFVYALSPNQAQHDIGVCFSVPAPAAGSYTLIVTAANVDPDPPGLSFQL